MEARISCRLTMSDLAASVELSVPQLTGLRDTGLTAGAYLHRLRMSRARWLRTGAPDGGQPMRDARPVLQIGQ